MPSITVTFVVCPVLLLTLLTTATSAIPSPLKSPVTTADGLGGVSGTMVGTRKLPSALPRSTVTSPPWLLAVTRSEIPSPLVSSRSRPIGPLSVGYGLPGKGAKAPPEFCSV